MRVALLLRHGEREHAPNEVMKHSHVELLASTPAERDRLRVLAEELKAGAPEAARFATAYNFGPGEDDARPVSWIAERMASFWGNGASWVLDENHGPHEAGYLRLDASRARRDLAWTPHLRLETALDWLVAWYRTWQSSPNAMNDFTLSQIVQYRTLVAATNNAAGPGGNKPD